MTTVPPVATDADARPVMLCADDFGMTEGITQGIEELARARRLSATSAMVTLRHWPAHAPRLKALAEHIAIGLHINLTVGLSASDCPGLAPAGRLPELKPLIGAALRGRIDIDEIATEVATQIEMFRARVGALPDFVDGHQHVHALPGVRTGVLAALARHYPGGGVLVRDPTDSIRAIVRRQAAARKALVIAGLCRGFGGQARAAGFTTNAGFSGTSDFDARVPFAAELERFVIAAGPRHLVMCHPGYMDEELRGLDPVTARREQELAAIGKADWLRGRLASRADVLAWGRRDQS